MSVLKFVAFGLAAPVLAGAVALAAEAPTDGGKAAAAASDAGVVAETAGNREGRQGPKRGHPIQPTPAGQATSLRWWQQAQSPRADGETVDLLTPRGSESNAGNERRSKVTLCHCHSHRCHTIRVADRAVDAHLAHGDTLGPCPGDETASEP